MKILYIDMDGVVADFNKRILEIEPNFEFYESKKVTQDIEDICVKTNRFFLDLFPIENAVESVTKLFDLYDIYFLSAPMWCLPISYTEKRLWLEKYFGDLAEKRLILSHRKDLCIGDFLVDDRLAHGSNLFKGKHIHFGNEEFPTWKEVLNYLKEQA